MKISEKQKAYSAFLVLLIFASIRYGVGFDYYSYRSLVEHKLREKEFGRLELLSKVIVEIGYYTYYQVFFVIGSFLTLYPIYKICSNYSLNPCLSLIIYYLHPLFYLDYFSIVRNGIAFSFVFLALVLLFEKKWIKSLLFLICACLFHKSAAVGFLIYPIYYIKSGHTPHLAFYLLSFGMSIIASRLITQYGSSIGLLAMAARSMKSANEGGGMMTIIVNGIAVINFLFWNRIAKQGKYNSTFLSMITAGVCIWNCLLPLDYILASRLSRFFLSPLIIIIPCYIKMVNLEVGLVVKRFIYYFFILLFMSYFYINVQGFYRHNGRMSNIPYQTIFYKTDYTNLRR